MNNAVIVDYARSAFQPARKGGLASMRPDELVAKIVRAIVDRSHINLDDLEDLIVGCAFPEGEQGYNIGRIAGLMAGLPNATGGATINRWCGSSMQSIHMAAGSIALGAGDLFVCAGVESMTRVPMMGFNPLPHPTFAKDRPDTYISMGHTAENVADRWKISRKAQEEFAAMSHARAAKAQSENLLDNEIIPVETKAGLVDRDGCIRPDTTPGILADLKPIFRQDGSVTAGTSSPLTDGASAVILASEAYAKEQGLNILARIKSTAVSGCDPAIMGIGPVQASKKAMARAGLSPDQLDVVELNEAFASQSLACIADLGLDRNKVNIDGGAIAIGHPLGATGARIVGKAASLLKREGANYALASQCIGGGQGIATILEAV